MHMASRLQRLLLALVLLAGWQLALVHPLKHFDSKGGYVHLADGHSHERKSGSADVLCDVVAALAACVPEMPAGLSPLCCRHDSPLSSNPASHLAAAAPPFLAQGPPASL
jgi:hypothetical protein